MLVAYKFNKFCYVCYFFKWNIFHILLSIRIIIEKTLKSYKIFYIYFVFYFVVNKFNE